MEKLLSSKNFYPKLLVGQHKIDKGKSNGVNFLTLSKNNMHSK